MKPSMPKFIPYTVSMSVNSLAAVMTPAKELLITAVGPPDCPMTAFPFMLIPYTIRGKMAIYFYKIKLEYYRLIFYTVVMVKRTGLVYTELLRLGPMANQELAEHLDLSPGGITQIVKPLVTMGLLEERAPDHYRAEKLIHDRHPEKKKRRKTTLAPRAAYGYCLVAMIRRYTLVFRKVDFAMGLDPGFISTIDLDLPEHPEEMIARTIEDIRNADRRRLLAVGFTVSGRVDLQTHRILYSNNLGYLVDIDLGQTITDRTGVPAVVVNDAYALALGERYTGAARTIEHFLTFFVDEGAGMGICINGEPYQGYQNFAGECGLSILEPGGLPKSGLVDGSFEAYVSQIAVWNQLASTSLSKPMKEAGVDENRVYPFFLERIAKRDADALQVLSFIAGKIGLLCANLIVLFSPQKIFFAGPLAFAGESIEVPVREAIRRFVPKGIVEPVKERFVVCGDFGDRMTLGTAWAAFHRHLNEFDAR